MTSQLVTIYILLHDYELRLSGDVYKNARWSAVIGLTLDCNQDNDLSLLKATDLKS